MHLFGEHLVKCGKIDLEIGKAGRHHAQFCAGQIHIWIILREERGKGENLVARRSHQAERMRQRAGSAAGHEDVCTRIIHAEAAVQRLGDRLAHRGDAQAGAVAMHEHGILVLNQVDQRVVVCFRCGHAGIAQTVVEDVIIADLFAACRGVFAQLTDDGLAGKHGLVLLGNHGSFLPYL